MQGILIAEDEVLGLQTRLELAASSAEAFAVALEAWNTTRLEAVDEVDAIIAADPYVTEGVAEYDVREYDVVLAAPGAEALQG